MKNDILDSFDELAKAKKTTALNLRLILLFSLIVIMAVLAWTYKINSEAMNKIIVIDKSGEYLKTSTQDNEKLFVALVKTTCSQLTYYANSFERSTIEENQARAMFLCDKIDLQRVFAVYEQDKCYHEVTSRGVIYRCKFEKLHELSGDNEPYNVIFTSILTIIDGNIETKYRITSRGSLLTVAPQFPENSTGFYFNSYAQSHKQITIDEQND